MRAEARIGTINARPRIYCSFWTKRRRRYRLAEGKKRGGLLRVPREETVKDPLVKLAIEASPIIVIVVPLLLVWGFRAIRALWEGWNNFWTYEAKRLPGNDT